MRDVTFSHDGRWLLIATDVGARAYEWTDVLRADVIMPPPTHFADAPPVTYQLVPGHEKIEAITNAVAHDRKNDWMLFAGIEGEAGAVDLKTGQRRTLLEVPGRPPLSHMELSHDGSVLCIRYKPVHFERSPKTPWSLQFWNYGKLCSAQNVALK